MPSRLSYQSDLMHEPCDRNDRASRVALDQRAREAHLQLERIERLLVPRAPVTPSGEVGFSVFLRSAFFPEILD